MAIFSNQATLTLGGQTIPSNIAYGELLEVLTLEKTALETAYTPDGTLTYVVTLRNTGTTALTGLTITDDLGGYPFGAGTVYPLAYQDGTLRYFADGVLQATPVVTAGPPLTVTGINVSPGGSSVLVYQALPTAFANPGSDGTVTNTVTATGGGLTTPVTASFTLPAAAAPQLSITKSICPAQVTDNDRVTYTFLIRNTGTVPVVATDNAQITDDFDPILTGLSVTFNGTPWAQGTQYTYSEATGSFVTLPGNITVPAATVTQDPTTGAYTLTPGISTLTVVGTI